MNTEVKTSFGSDDDQIKLIFRARELSTVCGVKDGQILKVSTTEYGIIKKGAVLPLEPSQVPIPFMDAYAKFENLEHPPKYPYLIELVNGV